MCACACRSTLEGAALDITVLETLKASGEVLRQMGVTGEGLRAVERLVSGIEDSMQNAAEITTVLSSGSVSGVVNSMAAYGMPAIDEDELMRELEGMTLDGEGEVVVAVAGNQLVADTGSAGQQAEEVLPPRKHTSTVPTNNHNVQQEQRHPTNKLPVLVRKDREAAESEENAPTPAATDAVEAVALF